MKSTVVLVFLIKYDFHTYLLLLTGLPVTLAESGFSPFLVSFFFCFIMQVTCHSCQVNHDKVPSVAKWWFVITKGREIPKFPQVAKKKKMFNIHVCKSVVLDRMECLNCNPMLSDKDIKQLSWYLGWFSVLPQSSNNYDWFLNEQFTLNSLPKWKCCSITIWVCTIFKVVEC